MPIPEGLIPRGPSPVTLLVLTKFVDFLCALANGCDVIASLPNPNQYDFDVGVERLFHRAGLGGADEAFAQFFGDTSGHVDCGFELGNTAGRLRGHVLLDLNAQAAEI